MLVSDFDYALPPELIAQSPMPDRDSSRMMALDKTTGRITHGRFTDLPGYLRPGDVLVINDTRVFPARLTGVKMPTGGRIEALLLKDMGENRYAALVKGKASVGTELLFGDRLAARVVEDMGGGKKLIGFMLDEDLESAIEALGRMPLPLYIDQEKRDESEDRERYQTVYAKKRGAVAAPTAGLHFTTGTLDSIKAVGVQVVAVTLHVGISTFMPVREEVVENHLMQEEEYEVGSKTAETVNLAKAEGRRVVAVGTTSARALESASDETGRLSAGSSSTGLYIYPGYRFKVVDGLVTNFHLPKSTLLMLVCSLAGRDNVLAAYREAVASGYRFYSYGDCMFIY